MPSTYEQIGLDAVSSIAEKVAPVNYASLARSLSVVGDYDSQMGSSMDYVDKFQKLSLIKSREDSVRSNYDSGLVSLVDYSIN